MRERFLFSFYMFLISSEKRRSFSSPRNLIKDFPLGMRAKMMEILGYLGAVDVSSNRWMVFMVRPFQTFAGDIKC